MSCEEVFGFQGASGHYSKIRGHNFDKDWQLCEESRLRPTSTCILCVAPVCSQECTVSKVINNKVITPPVFNSGTPAIITVNPHCDA